MTTVTAKADAAGMTMVTITDMVTAMQPSPADVVEAMTMITVMVTPIPMTAGTITVIPIPMIMDMLTSTKAAAAMIMTTATPILMGKGAAAGTNITGIRMLTPMRMTIRIPMTAMVTGSWRKAPG
ncbi:MAG TPA: hypothetical protein VGE29_11970 [Prosthecobacter sp.]